MIFSVWDNKNKSLSWDDTELFYKERNLITVPVLYRGIYKTDLIKEIADEVISRGGEGIVVRNESAFTYDCFSENIAKYVREHHVQTNKY